MILSQNTSGFSEDEQLHITSKIRKLARLMLKNGEIKDQDFISHKIVNFQNDEMQSFKDNLVTNRRRSIILTHTKHIEVEYGKRKAKEAEAKVKAEKAASRKVNKVVNPKIPKKSKK